MSAPLVPSPLDYVGRRPFAFYPPIRNAHPNAWVIGTSAWTEVQVVNARDGYELWIPRQYIGAVSESDSPLLIVGLTKELDFRNGTLAPRVKRVIEMPHAPEANQQPEQEPARPFTPATVVGIRLEQQGTSKINKALGVLCIAAVLLALLAALLAASSRILPFHA